MNTLSIIAICIGGALLTLFVLYWILVLYIRCTLYPECTDSRDMLDKLVIVTGGTSGIGTECVYDLYLKGAKVVFTGRNAKNVKKTIIPELKSRLKEEIQKSSEDAALFTEQLQELNEGEWDEEDNFESTFLYFRKLDQSSLRQTKEFCDWVKENFNSLDTLHNNAGLMVETFRETEDGFEFMMGINHYSHYLITHELLDLIKASPRCRVVNTSSIMSHKMAGIDPYIDLDDLEWKKSHQKFDGAHRYANSKLANVLFTVALARFFEVNNIEAKTVSLHPGAINSGFGRDFETCLSKLVVAFLKPFYGSPKDGCQTNLACIYRKYEDLEDGMYYDRLKVVKRNQVADDEEYVERFWDLSRQQILEKFGQDLEQFPFFLDEKKLNVAPGGGESTLVTGESTIAGDFSSNATESLL